jgi:hypothetical protein
MFKACSDVYNSLIIILNVFQLTILKMFHDGDSCSNILMQLQNNYTKVKFV